MAALVQQQLGLADQTAYRALNALAERAVLTPGTLRKRGQVWVAADITDALDRFAERAGRRRRPVA